MFLGKGVLKICNKFTREHLSRNVIFIEIALRQWCSPGNSLDIFRTGFYKNTSGGMLLNKNKGHKLMAMMKSPHA